MYSKIPFITVHCIHFLHYYFLFTRLLLPSLRDRFPIFLDQIWSLKDSHIVGHQHGFTGNRSAVQLRSTDTPADVCDGVNRSADPWQEIARGHKTFQPTECGMRFFGTLEWKAFQKKQSPRQRSDGHGALPPSHSSS
jgi:hypothetical protein